MRERPCFVRICVYVVLCVRTYIVLVCACCVYVCVCVCVCVRRALCSCARGMEGVSEY